MVGTFENGLYDTPPASLHAPFACPGKPDRVDNHCAEMWGIGGDDHPTVYRAKFASVPLRKGWLTLHNNGVIC